MKCGKDTRKFCPYIRKPCIENECIAWKRWHKYENVMRCVLINEVIKTFEDADSLLIYIQKSNDNTDNNTQVELKDD